MKKSLTKVGAIFLAIIFILLSIQPVHSKNNTYVQSYVEDFEDGQAQGWELESGWQIVGF